MDTMKILVRAPNWIGDCVMAIPAIHTLRERYPEGEIWIAARSWAVDIFSLVEGITGIITLDEPGKKSGVRDSASRIRAGSFDAGLLLTNSFHSALLFAMAKIPKRWGYRSDGRSFLLTRGVNKKQPDIPRHHVYYYLDLLSGLGIPPPSQTPRMRLKKPGEPLAATRKRLTDLGWSSGAPLITLNPGAQYGPAKRWPASRFRDAARILAEKKGAFFAVVGSASEAPLAEDIVSGLGPAACSLTGKTSLHELASVLCLSSVFITNDSGPMHIANALGVPVAAVFGPTDHRATGPFQDPSALIRHAVPCWPCLYRECPFDHGCMHLIPPEEVVEACIRLLNAGGGPSASP